MAAKRVWKFSIKIGRCVFTIPSDHQFLSAGFVGGEPVAWALVDPFSSMTTRSIFAASTGLPIPVEYSVFLGSAVTPQGALHVFLMANEHQE